MGLLKDLEQGKMTLSMDGTHPADYNSTNPDGATDVNQLKENAGLDPVSLKDSQLDLDGLDQPKYWDNRPS